MANAVGSYAGGEVTKIAMLLAVTLAYGGCMANAVGSYAGGEVTKTAMLLAVTLAYGRCMANAVGCYADVSWMYGQCSWLLRWCMAGA